MAFKKKIIPLFFVGLLAFYCHCLGQGQFPFKGQVNKDGVNVRSNSTVSSQPVCLVNKGQRLEVITELYGWYKIRLPRKAPVYINKKLAECINSDEQNQCSAIKVLKDRVNIRLSPDESSAILGRASQNETITVTAVKQDWYKIEPTPNTFGWINQKFVDRLPEEVPSQEIAATTTKPPQVKPEAPLPADALVIEGTLKPHGIFFKRAVAHKLITEENAVFLLKGNKDELDAAKLRKVKITGIKSTEPLRQKYPTLEVLKLEVLD